MHKLIHLHLSQQFRISGDGLKLDEVSSCAKKAQSVLLDGK